MSGRYNRCSECGQVYGGHATGCPEAGAHDEPEPDVTVQECRCCGMDAKCVTEKAGPICALCAPKP